MVHFCVHSINRAEAMQDKEACIIISAGSDSKSLQNQQLHMTEQKDKAGWGRGSSKCKEN